MEQKQGAPGTEQGPKTKAAIDSAPEMMAELMREFIDHKELNARVKIRLRMKALLDLVAVDTQYPKSPALDTGGPMRRRRRRFGEPVFAEPYQQAPGIAGAIADRLDDGMLGEVQPVPGAEAVGGDELLG